jgi:ABC-2 type transport system ATP-binding protein
MYINTPYTNEVTSMLVAAGLRKRFGDVTALDGLDLTVPPGEVTGLIGPNGAGKSTFMALAAGLLRPDAGAVTIAGADPARDPRRARALLGLAPQEVALYPRVTVGEHLRLFGRLADLRGAALRRRIDETVQALRLTELLDRPAGALSGGQRRRTHAATALLHRPRVLLLDEPTAGADPTTREALLAAVRARAGDGAAVCYTTHYLPELEILQATVALLVRGRIIARGSRQDLLARLQGARHCQPALDDLYRSLLGAPPQGALPQGAPPQPSESEGAPDAA